MIESIVNMFQLVVMLVCLFVSGVYAVKWNRQSGMLLAMVYGGMALGDLYWQLHLFFYGYTPKVFYVADMCWYTEYLFLFLLLRDLSTKEERAERPGAAWLLPLFPAAMCAVYVGLGDSLATNLIAAALMSLLLFHAARGLIYLRKRPAEAGRRGMYIAVLVFCAAEYCLWTASCFWMGDTLANPYYWFDVLLTISMALFLPAYRRAVTACTT